MTRLLQGRTVEYVESYGKFSSRRHEWLTQKMGMRPFIVQYSFERSIESGIGPITTTQPSSKTSPGTASMPTGGLEFDAFDRAVDKAC